MAVTAEQRDMIIGGAIIAVILLATIFYLGAADIRVPDAKSVQSVAAAIWGGIFGMLVVAVGIVLVYLAIVNKSWIPAAIGAVVVLVGLPLVGVTVGVPAILTPLVSLVQLIVDLINALLDAAKGVGGWFS